MSATECPPHYDCTHSEDGAIKCPACGEVWCGVCETHEAECEACPSCRREYEACTDCGGKPEALPDEDAWEMARGEER